MEDNNNTSEDIYNSSPGTSRFEKIINTIKDNVKNPEKTQKYHIIEAAKELEKNKFQLNKICAKVCEELKGVIKPRYIREVLESKYKETEKIKDELIIAQLENDGKSSSERRVQTEAVVPHAKNDEDNDNKGEENDKKMSLSERKALYMQNKYYRKLPGFEQGGKGWGKPKSSSSSWVSTEEKEERSEKQTSNDFYNDDMEILKQKVKELKIENKQLIQQNKNLMEQRVEYTTVTVYPAMYQDIINILTENPPGKVYLDFDRDFIVSNVRTTEIDKDKEYNKKRFIE